MRKNLKVSHWLSIYILQELVHPKQPIFIFIAHMFFWRTKKITEKIDNKKQLVEMTWSNLDQPMINWWFGSWDPPMKGIVT